MDSPASLVGLINQMQQLENSIASIVFEVVLKLSALTDANMFVLVENGEGRRFGGKRQLCDAYLQGALMSLGGETEVALNPASEGLLQRHIDGGEPTPPHPYILNRGGPLGSGGDAHGRTDVDSLKIPTKERSSSASSNSFHGESGRKRGYEDAVTAVSASITPDFPSPSKSARMFFHKTSPESSSLAVAAAAAAAAELANAERPEDLSRTDCVPKREVILDDDAEVMVEDGGGGGGGERRGGSEMPLTCFQGAQVAAISAMEAAVIDAMPRPDPVSFANGIEELDQYFAVSDKVIAVKSIPLDKLKGLDSQSQSFEYKLFTSTLYDISKLAARCSPSFDKKNPSSKAHFHNVFERVWSEFSFLELLAQLGVQPKNGFSMRNFVRATMQKTYGHILDKLLANSLKLKEPLLT